jgi:two-component system osmolarity sensor histidine kinase EnvZ
MIAAFLKARMPRSLYARAVLILLVPVITILLVVSIVFIQRLYENVTRQMTEGVSHELRLVLDRIEAATDAASALEAAFEVAIPLGIELQAGAPDFSDQISSLDLSGRVVAQTLRAELPEVSAVDLVSRDGFVRLLIATSHGPLELDLARRRVSARNPHQFLVLIGLTAFFMTAIALIYLRNQVRPIRRLARAADAFGKGRSLPYRPSGATEVRQAGAAFLDMRDRIERQIEQRTLMLSGVSHDLRTPLTRMKLELSLVEDEQSVQAMQRDITDMERMLDAFLEFAKGDSKEETVKRLPAEVAEDAVKRAVRGGMDVTLGELGETRMVMLREHAVARALDNLIGNAARYAGSAQVSVAQDASFIRFYIDDPGAGIPEEKRSEAIKPFTRLDVSRNQNSGSGVGLGLTIAADIARNHGGSLQLGKSPTLGGLRAEFSIPI